MRDIQTNYSWKPVFKNTSPIPLKVLVKTLPTSGNLVYEYNPLRNYRLTKNMFLFKESLYSIYELFANFNLCLDVSKGSSRNGKCVYKDSTGTSYQAYSNSPGTGWTLITNANLPSELESLYSSTRYASQSSFESAIIDARFTKWNDKSNILDSNTNPVLYESGELTDFITNELSFSLENPVTIVPQYSYDGSVNLILNDGVNQPRLINSRFSATGRDTYEIVDRKGDNDTNIYDQGEQFDIDTSLYKKYTKIPKLRFDGVEAGGNLPIGSYHFYFKLADADGNETDFVAESGLVSVFIGSGYPSTTYTGISEENSVKSVRFFISNIDASYNYVHVYYSRSSAQPDQAALTHYCRIDKKFVVNNAQQCNILITGFETTTDVAASDINLQYNMVSAARTATTCKNMLILGNVHKPDIPYEELADLSLRFLPYLKETTYALDIDQDYNIMSNTLGYYDPKFIYSNVGYWDSEYYRIGIVYIMPNNELTPVFNIRGRYAVQAFGTKDLLTANNITSESPFYNNKVNDGQYNHYKLYKITDNGAKERVKINIDESTFYTIKPNSEDEGVSSLDNSFYENSKGVITMKSEHDTDRIFALDIRVDDETLQELKKYVKGYFFVRQERIPTILCQGITIGVDNISHTPTIPTQGGFLDLLCSSLDKSTYVEVQDIADVNYISEGFLTRYSFSIVNKKIGFWKKFGKIAAAVGIVATLAAASVVSAGALSGPSVAVGIVAVGAVLKVTAIAAAGLIATGALVGAHLTVGRAIRNSHTPKKLDGRNTKLESNQERKETSISRKLGGDFMNRVIIMDPNKNTTGAALCPDYEVNQAYFNQIFTGGTFIIQPTVSQNINILEGYYSSYFTNNNGRHFYVPKYYDQSTTTTKTGKVIGVPDDVPTVAIGTDKYRSRAGMAEEAWRYEQVGNEWEDNDKKINSEIIRGSFGPYLALSGYTGDVCETVNFMIPGYDKATISDYISIRMDDASSYYAISERFSMEDSDDNLIDPLSGLIAARDKSCGYSWELYRGDCYICQVTHRINRNFNDPSAPYNHTIVDAESWKNGYDPDNTEKFAEINLGDVNAVQLGMWVTFKVRSTYNHNIRTVDNSHVDERLMCGHGRGYFPNLPMDTEGSYKIPESSVYNMGFKKSVSERFNFALPDVPYIKNWFGTRIMYSDIHVNDAYKNGFRVFRGTSYIDCPRTYGEIVKLVEFRGSLIVVFEHGIGVISVSPEQASASASRGHDYLNISPALSQPVILSDTIGSQWEESILKTPGNFGDGVCYVYGVDTVSKKIWRTNGSSVECISDMKVQEFLNNNITLGEREKTPVIGIRNVKTCYNSFKRDVMFTFYDNLSGFEEKVWNICWNELLQTFITFYSWVPSYMENINNMPFSFNRNTSKWIAKLGISHADNSFADGITLTNNIMENNLTASSASSVSTNFKVDIMNSSGIVEKVLLKPKPASTYMKENAPSGYWAYTSSTYTKGLVGILGITGINLPTGEDIIYKIDYSIERDNYRNDKLFEIKEIGYYTNKYQNTTSGTNGLTTISSIKIPVYGLYLKKGVSVVNLASELYYRNKAGHCYSDWDSNKSIETVADSIKNKYPIFKNRAGKRLTLPKEKMINPTHIVRLLNIRAKVYGYYGGMEQTVTEYFYNYANKSATSTSEEGGSQNIDVIGSAQQSAGQWVDCGYYESVVAVIPRWNLQFLSTDFWKHGQAGLIDIADKIYPAYWYGEQHPFEFEFIVVDNPTVHKIFTNLEIMSNNVKPESFHFEVIGDAYDFSEDMVNMYFRQEAMKALYQYNGADLTYNRNFLETQPDQCKKSADLPHNYYARQDTFNEIYDSYKRAISETGAKDYDHLTGSEIMYYPTRQEYRIWIHQRAISSDDFEGDSTSKLKNPDGSYIYSDDEWESARAVINSNCNYVEGKWKVSINPIVVCYRNEYNMSKYKEKGLSEDNSLWTSPNRPPLPVFNSPLPVDENGEYILENGLTDEDWPQELTDIGYSNKDLDSVRWLDSVDIHGYQWGGEGTACNREEVDIRDKFVKIRIRYTGDQLAIIDFINTIYQISLA